MNSPICEHVSISFMLWRMTYFNPHPYIHIYWLSTAFFLLLLSTKTHSALYFIFFFLSFSIPFVIAGMDLFVSDNLPIYLSYFSLYHVLYLIVRAFITHTHSREESSLSWYKISIVYSHNNFTLNLIDHWASFLRHYKYPFIVQNSAKVLCWLSDVTWK